MTYEMANAYQTQEQIDACDWVVTIKWGTDKDVVRTYGLKTREEYWAFLMGVEQSNGWLDYEVVGEDDD